ncbi:MAG: aminotransferase class V-fold PLP-dependent enzyme [Geminicoccaceae bacterium]|nr:aminotransferase class V-fold PLP-dependent enzyme [Geminicoccaceae bacterium]
MSLAPGRPLRARFPIFAAMSGQPFHYLDNGATGQIVDVAADALLGFETRSRANVKRGVYGLADAATVAFDEARAAMAAFLGAGSSEEIVFTSGTTMALNIVAHGLAGELRPGDRIVSSALEHHSNIVPWQLAAAPAGAVVHAIPATGEGRLDLDALAAMVDERTRIVSVTHVSNVTGAVSDIARIRTLAPDAILVVDGAQRAPHGPLDVQAMGCDFYALSSHKMFGPTGAGVLWGRGERLDALPPFLGGGEMIRRVSFDGTSYARPPHRFEAGTPPIGPVLGMAAAARWLMQQDWSAWAAHEKRLGERLLNGLAAIDGVRMHGPQGLQERLGIVAFEVDGVHAHDVCQMLGDRGVCLRGGHHCAQPLMERFDVAATARASLAPYNDADDVDALMHGLPEVIGRLR